MPGCELTVRLSSSSGPSKARLEIGSPSASSAAAKTAAAAGEASERALAMPTYCDPCPGNTSAKWDTRDVTVSAFDGISVGIRAMMHLMDDSDLSPAVLAARDQMQNPRLLSDRIAMGRALWRDLVVGFAAQIPTLGLGFSQLAALYAADGTETLTIADLAEQIGRSPSATSRLVD